MSHLRCTWPHFGWSKNKESFSELEGRYEASEGVTLHDGFEVSLIHFFSGDEKKLRFVLGTMLN